MRGRFMQLALALPSESIERALALASAARSTAPGEEMLSCAILVSAGDGLLASVPQSYSCHYRALFVGARAEHRTRARAAATLLEKAQVVLGRVDSERAFELKVHAFALQEVSFLLLGEIENARVVLCAAEDALNRRAILTSSDDCGLPENSLVRQSMRYFNFRSALLESLPKVLARDFLLLGPGAEPLGAPRIEKTCPSLARKLKSRIDYGDDTSATAAAAVVISLQQIRLGLSCAQTEEGATNWERSSDALFRDAGKLLDPNQLHVIVTILRLTNIVFRGLSLMRGGDTRGLRSMTPNLIQALEDLKILPEDLHEHEWEWMCPPGDVLKSLTLLVLSAASFNLEQGKIAIRFAQESVDSLKVTKTDFLSSTSGCDDCRVALSFSARIQLASSCMAGHRVEVSRNALSDLTAFSASAANLTEPVQFCLKILFIQLSPQREKRSADFSDFASLVNAASGVDDLKAIVAIYELLFREKSNQGAQSRKVQTANRTITAAYEFAQGQVNIGSDVLLAREKFHAALAMTGNEQVIGNVLLGLAEIFQQHSTITPEALKLAETAKNLATCAGDACLDLRACRRMSKLLYRTPDSPERKRLLKAVASDEAKAEAMFIIS